MIASQLPGRCDLISNCDVISSTKNWASVTQGQCVQIVVYIAFMDSLCHVRNKIMYVLSWRTVSAPTRALCCCLFTSLLRNAGNKHQNNTRERWNSSSLEYIHYSPQNRFFSHSMGSTAYMAWPFSVSSIPFQWQLCPVYFIQYWICSGIFGSCNVTWLRFAPAIFKAIARLLLCVSTRSLPGYEYITPVTYQLQGRYQGTNI